MVQEVFNRYIWLVDTIYSAERISFDEINEKWLRCSIGDGKEIPLRTFHNHIKAIEDMFDINIVCHRRDGYRYYIENADDIKGGGVRAWLLNTFAVNNLINESHKLKPRILFENIPSGQRFLAPIIEAMRDNLVLEVTYQGFEKDNPSTFEVAPYCVKVFRQRWYMVGCSPLINSIMIYALDRVKAVHTTNHKFKLPKEFNGKEFFDNCFGVTVGDGTATETVRLKVFGKQVHYIRALPLHHSQKEVETKNGYAVFEYYIKPTYDFRQEILSHGADLEVLSPTKFRNEVKNVIAQQTKRYGK
ncbi:WYL domain-containing protein [Bacteroidia bacterium]|nr:WYL domain-containing protein [Bacteroidia bacterium]